MFDVIRNNVRVPAQVFGDLMANITCNEVGARQLLEFMDEYALDDLAPLSAAIRGQSERAIRDRIAALSPTTAISPQLPSAVIAPAHRAAISWSATSVQVGDNDKPQAGVPGRLRAALLRSRRVGSRGLFAE